MYKDGTACLWVPGERWRYWPLGESMTTLLKGPVLSFFVAQSIYERTSTWPFGERSHGAKGIFEAYREMVGAARTNAVLMDFIKMLGKRPIKGHWSCPCGSGSPLRSCHHDQVLSLSEQIDVSEARLALKQLRLDEELPRLLVEPN